MTFIDEVNPDAVQKRSESCPPVLRPNHNFQDFLPRTFFFKKQFCFDLFPILVAEFLCVGFSQGPTVQQALSFCFNTNSSNTICRSETCGPKPQKTTKLLEGRECITPGTSMEPLKIPTWKRRDIYKPSIFGFHVSIQGCSMFSCCSSILTSRELWSYTVFIIISMGGYCYCYCCCCCYYYYYYWVLEFLGGIFPLCAFV